VEPVFAALTLGTPPRPPRPLSPAFVLPSSPPPPFRPAETARVSRTVREWPPNRGTYVSYPRSWTAAAECHALVAFYSRVTTCESTTSVEKRVEWRQYCRNQPRFGTPPDRYSPINSHLTPWPAAWSCRRRHRKRLFGFAHFPCRHDAFASPMSYLYPLCSCIRWKNACVRSLA